MNDRYLGRLENIGLFFDGHKPGFLDGTVAARGPGMRDVGYFLAGTLKQRDQRHHLEMLQHYRQELLNNGVAAPSIDELLRQFSWHIVKST